MRAERNSGAGTVRVVRPWKKPEEKKMPRKAVFLFAVPKEDEEGNLRLPLSIGYKLVTNSLTCCHVIFLCVRERLLLLFPGFTSLLLLPGFTSEEEESYSR